VQVWRPADEKIIGEFPTQVPFTEYFVISYDNKYIATIVNDKAKIWAIDTGKEIATLEKFKPMIQVHQLCYVSKENVVWRKNSVVEIYNMKTDKRIVLWSLDDITLVRVSWDNKYLMILKENTYNGDGQLMKVYEFETLKEYSSYKI
jgi:hypothetical protein